MKDTQNLTIVFLLVTAAVLAAILVGTYAAPSAYADSPYKGGDYVIARGSWAETLDIIYVLDIAAKKLNVYVPDVRNNRLDVRDTVNLEQAFR